MIFISLLVPIFLFFGCQNDLHNTSNIVEAEEFEKIDLNPVKATVLKASDFVDSIEFISLETTAESEFAEIAQLESVNDKYVILDKNTSQIFFFTKDGKFINKISPNDTRLPFSFKKVIHFNIDRSADRLYFDDIQSQNIFEFNLEGKFLKVYKKDHEDYKIRELHHFKNYLIRYFAYKSLSNNVGLSYNIMVRKHNGIENTYLPFDASIIDRQDVYGVNRYFFESEQQLFFAMPYDQNVYCFDNLGEMHRIFEFEFPNDFSLPKSFVTNSKYTNIRKQFLKESEKKIYSITDFSKIGEKLVFRLVGVKYSEKFLYDLTTRKLVSLDKYISDSISYYLPILGNNILGTDKQKIISTLTSKKVVSLVNFRNKQVGYQKFLPESVRALYSRGNDQNPVLMLTTLKNEILYK